MEFFAGILMVLKVMLVPVYLCSICLCIDTYINVRNYLAGKQKCTFEDAGKLETVSQYDNNFFDDGK